MAEQQTEKKPKFSPVTPVTHFAAAILAGYVTRVGFETISPQKLQLIAATAVALDALVKELQ